MGGEGGVGGWAEAGSEHTQDGPGGNGGPGGNAVGGAFCGSGGSLLAWNITAAGNSVSGGLPGAGGPGGAAFGTTTGAPGTNGTPGVGEGDSIGTLGGTVTLKNSIISASFFLDTNIFGPLVDAGYNLDAEYQKVLTNPTSLTRGGAGLAPFGNYGGPTLTMALFPLSPAIDAADPNDFPATDQRGVPRPFGPAPDIGAVENTNTVTISGTITGLQAGDNATVISGGQSTVTALHGGYSIQIDEVTSVISPSNVNYIFMPPFQIVSLESNQTDVNFQAYLLNTVTLALGSDNTLNLTFAQPNYQSFRIEVSTNLSSWTPISSNNSSISFPITNGASSFFRVVSP
jgi:hypothetical protein